ncbi:GDSL-type esterase/lipase family protein [Sinomicrobium soli]|uniref:GDSL-type esterase/lipase family protein n=1 Tax=Sinomicrobium sp. N-1-3-6 TaxID=2219864 RepID=UPI000DCCB818|nr:GDSL-type esterase/lipase family protein [Sinomicrobium sp. N-1-3-6]RAV30561.1 G-D-S-L family lipolytic protein [Sinomicrobium sp. N-1-3-6]
MRIRYCLVILFVLPLFYLHAQDATRFENDIKKFRQQSDTLDLSGYDAVMVGSSSVRMWKDIDSYFPGFSWLNRGFGGSQMSDVLYYREDLVFRHSFDKIFLYEGDNDIASGKSPGRVKRDFKELLDEIRDRMPETEVYIIGVKPCIQENRAGKRKKYMKFNRRMERWCNRREKFHFIDVWADMLGEDGNPVASFFLKDGIHMTAEGYAIWAENIRPFLK